MCGIVVAVEVCLIGMGYGEEGLRFPVEPEYEPQGLMLTWQGDPTTTMAVRWLSEVRGAGAAHAVSEADRGVWYSPEGVEDWKFAPAVAIPWVLTGLPGYVAEYYPDAFEMSLYYVNVTGLQPGTAYRMRVTSGSPEYRFRTAPATLEEPLSFVSGGGMWAGHEAVRMHRQAAGHNPLFAVFGGELFNAHDYETERMVAVMKEWHAEMVTEEGGYLIPMVSVIGEPDVTNREDLMSRAPFFAALFSGLYVEGRTYAALDFGNYLSLILLDTGHVNSIDGEQAGWLEAALAERGDGRHVFPVYHVAAWPSVAGRFERRESSHVREHWVPLFERHGIRVAFEHHNRAYKRTHPLRGGEVSEADGVVYLGDGAWSSNTVSVDGNVWYMAKGLSEQHFILTTLNPDGSVQHVAMNHSGEELDRYQVAAE